MSIYFVPKPEQPQSYQQKSISKTINYEGWNFNSGNYLFTTDTK